MRRVTFQSNEAWFHRPVVEYWRDLGAVLGPVLVGGGIAGAVLWSARLRQAPRVALVVLWVVVTFVFCSAIGLRHERYFLPAVPALAVLAGALGAAETYAGVPFLRQDARLASGVRWVVVALVVVGTAVSLRDTIGRLEEIARVGQRSDAFYVQLGTAIRGITSPDDRLMLSRPQTAYFAERNYFLSEYDANAAALIAALADPRNRITLVVEDSNQMLLPDMPAVERARFWAYVREHFTPVELPGARAAIYRRTR